jgi:hypothetical protein
MSYAEPKTIIKQINTTIHRLHIRNEKTGNTNGSECNAEYEQGDGVRDSGTTEEVPASDSQHQTKPKEQHSVRWVRLRRSFLFQHSVRKQHFSHARHSSPLSTTPE